MQDERGMRETERIFDTTSSLSIYEGNQERRHLHLRMRAEG